jgi:ammonia channel protein AmtB
LLLGEAATPAALSLYLAYLPAVAVATLPPTLALRERLPGWMAALGSLTVAALVYPLAGNWLAGGGWLMRTGETLGLGHGYVDMTAISTAALVGGVAALAGILIFGRRLPPLPPGSCRRCPPSTCRSWPSWARSWPSWAARPSTGPTPSTPRRG